MQNLNYIRNSSTNSFSRVGEFTAFGIRVFIKQPLPPQIDLKAGLQYVFGRLPKHVYQYIKYIVIGQFDFLQQREIDALYKDNTVYLTSHHENVQDLIADLVHEIAHSLEEHHAAELYGDKTIQNEFLAKRETLFNILNTRNLVTYPIKREDFYNLNYSMQFDNYLYNTIGYDKINYLTTNLFISPYGATSLREYFANAFEYFFVNDMTVVKKISPNVYNKLISMEI